MALSRVRGACGFAALRLCGLARRAESQALVLDAPRMGRFKRKPKPEPIHHSNRSGRYYIHDYQAFIAEMKAVSSMSRKGNCWDNAPMDSWITTARRESVSPTGANSLAARLADLFDYIEVFYKRKHRHVEFGYIIPSEFHSARAAQQMPVPCWLLSYRPKHRQSQFRLAEFSYLVA
jgi:putative transposase